MMKAAALQTVSVEKHGAAPLASCERLQAPKEALRIRAACFCLQKEEEPLIIANSEHLLNANTSSR